MRMRGMRVAGMRGMRRRRGSVVGWSGRGPWRRRIGRAAVFPSRIVAGRTRSAALLLEAADHLTQRVDLPFVPGFLPLGFLQQLQHQLHLIQRVAQVVDDHFNIFNGLPQGGWLHRSRRRRQIDGRARSGRRLGTLTRLMLMMPVLGSGHRLMDRSLRRLILIPILILIRILVVAVFLIIEALLVVRVVVLVGPGLVAVVVTVVAVFRSSAVGFPVFREDGLVLVGAERFGLLGFGGFRGNFDGRRGRFHRGGCGR